MFLIEGPTGGQSRFPRQGLVLSWREIKQSAKELESIRFDFLPYKVSNDHPPSRPIGDQDTVSSGQEVLVCRFRGWHKGTIVDSSPFGFVVDIFTYRDSPVWFATSFLETSFGLPFPIRNFQQMLGPCPYRT